jgi:hypothetical protein
MNVVEIADDPVETIILPKRSGKSRQSLVARFTDEATQALATGLSRQTDRSLMTWLADDAPESLEARRTSPLPPCGPGASRFSTSPGHAVSPSGTAFPGRPLTPSYLAVPC